MQAYLTRQTRPPNTKSRQMKTSRLFLIKEIAFFLDCPMYPINVNLARF
jgi:hypothetical protein